MQIKSYYNNHYGFHFLPELVIRVAILVAGTQFGEYNLHNLHKYHKIDLLKLLNNLFRISQNQQTNVRQHKPCNKKHRKYISVCDRTQLWMHTYTQASKGLDKLTLAILTKEANKMGKRIIHQ